MKNKSLIAFFLVFQMVLVLVVPTFVNAEMDDDNNLKINISEKIESNLNNTDSSEDGISLHYLDPELSQIYAGANHSVVVNNWGCVKTYGDNTYKQLGTTHYDENYSNEYYVTIPDDVQKVSTLLNHNLALAEGNVYAWGDNSYYQLGHKEENANAIPTKIDYFDNLNIIDVAAGGWFSLALASDGNVYAWGNNKYGQLAKGTTGGGSAIPCTVRDTFVEDTNVVAVLNNIEKISAGKYHALALKNNGEVYGWGRNSTDHCISDTDNFTYSIAMRIQGLPSNIIGIEAGDRCSFFLTDDGHVYAMGNNSTGQLGDGTNITRSTPVLLDIENVTAVESNGGSTLFLTSDGTVFACGANEYGQLGQGHANTRIETPVKVPGGTFTKIAAGGDHNLLYRCNEQYPEDQWYYRNATIYAIGRNDSGQCMCGNTDNIAYPKIVYEVENTDDYGPFGWTDTNLRPIDATFVSQHDENGNNNFYGDSVLKVNYTTRENDVNGWGEYSYLKFDISNIKKERISSAKLHFYVENGEDNRKSTREIGVYDTYVNDWDGSTMTWNNGRVGARSLLGSFNVTATGHMIEDVGWHSVDITDYLKDECVDNELSLVLKSISTQAYETVITAGVYNESFTEWDMHKHRNMPALEIKYDDEEDITINRSNYSPSSDTYIYQHESDKNFSDSEFLYINYTPNAQPSNWGQDSYLSFDIGNMTVFDRKSINRATLWLYVDKTSDNRESIRTVNITANDGLNYNSNILVWNMGRPIGEYNIGEFSVEGNGFNIVNPGWRKIDVTDFIKSSKNANVEFILKMTSIQAHPIKICSSENPSINTRPQLVVDSRSYVNEGNPIDIAFKDDNFLQAIRDLIKKTDGAIYYEDVKDIKVLDVSYKNINRLDGIEFFTSLEKLDCHLNNLTNVDFSKNTMLTDLNCSHNHLTQLDLSENVRLDCIKASHNELEEIDLSKNTLLTEIWLTGNELTKLDLSNNKQIKKIYCPYNYILSLDDIDLFQQVEKMEVDVLPTRKYRPIVFDINMFISNNNELCISGNVVPRSTVKVYDISDYENKYDFQDEDILSKIEIGEIVNQKIPDGIISILNTNDFQEKLTLSTSRQRYILLTVVYLGNGDIYVGKVKLIDNE